MRILAAVLAVACVGLAVVGGVTFLVQREWVLREIGSAPGRERVWQFV